MCPHHTHRPGSLAPLPISSCGTPEGLEACPAASPPVVRVAGCPPTKNIEAQGTRKQRAGVSPLLTRRLIIE